MCMDGYCNQLGNGTQLQILFCTSSPSKIYQPRSSLPNAIHFVHTWQSPRLPSLLPWPWIRCFCLQLARHQIDLSFLYGMGFGLMGRHIVVGSCFSPLCFIYFYLFPAIIYVLTAQRMHTACCNSTANDPIEFYSFIYCIACDKLIVGVSLA